MLNFNSILLSSDNSKELTEFYKKVLGKDPEMDEGGYAGFQVGNSYITIGPHDKVHGKNTNPERILINFETEDVKEEFERISKIEGVKVIAEPYQMEGMEEWQGYIATLADPDGNYFQLMTPWEEASN